MNLEEAKLIADLIEAKKHLNKAFLKVPKGFDSDRSYVVWKLLYDLEIDFSDLDSRVDQILSFMDLKINE